MRRRSAPIHGPVQNHGDGFGEDLGAGAGLDRLRRQMPPVGARPRHALKQAVQMARDRVQAKAAGKFALDVGHERERRGPRRWARRGLAEQQRIDGEQPPRFLVRGAAQHHPVEVREMTLRGLDRRDAAVEHDRQPRMAKLEPIDQRVVEWRHIAVFARRQPGEPGLARMHDQRIDPGRLDRRGQALQRHFRVLVVDADPAFDRDRDRDRSLHGGDAFGDQLRLRHQAGAEAALLNPIGRTADVEVDLVVPEVRANAGASRKRGRVAAAKLQRHRVLGFVESDQPGAIAA